MTCTYDCDCPECLMERILQPVLGFESEALNDLQAGLYRPDPVVVVFCKGCHEAGDCIYAGDASARIMCRVVQKAVRP